MYNPVATYRLQFHKEFSFNQFEEALPYFKKLGVRTIYASPIFESTPGSTHGYDGLNPHNINPEVGTEEQFLGIHQKLKEDNIGWLQDIVPNHMAFDPRNPWLMDVLEKGQRSEYASFFDVSWTGKLFHGRMMVPFLGNPLQEVIDNKELKIEYRDKRFVFNYFDSYYPLNAASYHYILTECQVPGDAVDLLKEQLIQLHRIEEPKAYALGWNEMLMQLASLMKNEGVAFSINTFLQHVSNDAVQLKKLADLQEYQLVFWQRTDTKINFRRFFTVNGLIALNIQDPGVFEYHHRYIKKLVEDGIIQGLRIDHIDGLYDPTQYLHELRRLAGEETYIVVEKILEPGEELLKEWPIQGNSGYDFLSIVNNLFTNKNSEAQFTNYYNDLVGDDTSIHQQIREKKAYILAENMGGELENLTGLFISLNLANADDTNQLNKDELSLAIGELLIQCPVYRYYGNKMPLPPQEAAQVKELLHQVRQSKPELENAVQLIEHALLVSPTEHNAEYNERALRFYQRCMQFTGPLMAKGVEDTLMYTYNRFIGHNEVGDSPEAFGITPWEYHEIMIARQRDWPLSINCTATHDTKRGEDVRARLNVLTDLPDEWFEKVDEWRQMNADLKLNGAPDDNDEYFIYQTLLGVYAMPGQPEDELVDRLQEYLQKALREAKVNSNWATPNTEYEDAVKSFAILLLDKQKPFWKSFSAFHHKVAEFGLINSLSQVLLRFTSPGVPDTYQGTEGWDLSMVDPDNRRPVDYGLLHHALNQVQNEIDKDRSAALANLWTHRFNANIKLWLTHFLFELRKKQRDVFLIGEYLPLKVNGEYKDHILAFERRYQQSSLVVVVPLHLAALCAQQQSEPGSIDWKDTEIEFQNDTTGLMVNLVDGSRHAANRQVKVSQLLTVLPIAVLQIEPEKTKKRSAGILMHITSLASPFGIGDMGPEAFKFADFLHRTGQRFWQILPLNPTEQGQGHSPYSSICSMAGNPLLISPELLVKNELLTPADLEAYRLKHTDMVDFAYASKAKRDLFDKAWQVFNQAVKPALYGQFETFIKEEKNWLDDFALYMLLKEKHKGAAWFQWPETYKLRDVDALEQIEADHGNELEKIKWLQFIFLLQWKELKKYCNQLDVQLFGDLPFYTSYDSVDVWANPGIFNIDKDGKMLQVAGVPPDHFSADGQLWGMPVFRWDVLKDQEYKWWIERLRKNTELFDLLRLDHFRAFADYWQVPAGETTAKNGQWKPGPGPDFFLAVKKKLGDLPFVAEDLGDINEPVYQLRDEFNMPGMKVLQFAFGDGMPTSNYIPHNYTENFLVYTGTHDNNTTKGWHRRDATIEEKENLNLYAGRTVSHDLVADVMIRLAYSSVAQIAIIPIQDILELDETARMNKPSTTKNNWAWRLLPAQYEGHAEKHLKMLTRLYNR